MRLRLIPILLAALAVAAAPAPDALADPGDARAAAVRFARALADSDVDGIGALLPGQGRIRLRLRRLGPEEGAFSGRQVESLFRNFFREGEIRSAEVERVDQHSGTYALGRVRVKGVDGEGRPLDLRLHLELQSENERWTLREIRETPP